MSGSLPAHLAAGAGDIPTYSSSDFRSLTMQPGGPGPMPAGSAPAACDPIAEACAVGGSHSTPMKLVGPGRGDYVAETTYRYVGPGRGDLGRPAAPRPWWLLLPALGLVLLAWPLSKQAQAEAPKNNDVKPVDNHAHEEEPQKEPEVQVEPEVVEPQQQQLPGECTFWGDPHFLTFDGARPSFYGEGELHIVRSDEVNIQGRYMGTKWTKGLAATNKIAVSGKFINNHILEVGAMEDGPITVDGVPILTAFPSTYTFDDVPGTLTYTVQGDLVDKATTKFERHILHMQLPMGVRVTVLRWENYLDFRLSMPPMTNQDGGCGNFNGDPSDDSTEAIFQRDGARVQDGDLLFAKRVPVEMSDTETKLLSTCPADRMARAQKECTQELSGVAGATSNPVQLQSCYLDICFGMNEHALATAKSLGM